MNVSAVTGRNNSAGNKMHLLKSINWASISMLSDSQLNGQGWLHYPVLEMVNPVGFL